MATRDSYGTKAGFLLVFACLPSWAQPHAPGRLHLFLKSNHPGAVIDYLKPGSQPDVVGQTDKEFELDVSGRGPKDNLEFRVRPDDLQRKTQSFLPQKVFYSLDPSLKEDARWRQQGVILQSSQRRFMVMVDPPGAPVYVGAPSGFSFVGRTKDLVVLDENDYLDSELKPTSVSLNIGTTSPTDSKTLFPFYGYGPRLNWIVTPWEKPEVPYKTREGGVINITYLPDENTTETLIPAPGLSQMLARARFWAGLHGVLVGLGLLGAALAAVAVPTTLWPALKSRRQLEEMRRRKDEMLKNVDISRDVLLGQAFGQWTTVKRLGAGGMAVVYYAVPTDSWKDEDAVAIKVMNADIVDDREYRDRFKREIKISSDLDHPNIVRLIDWGERDDRYFLVMEFIRGGTLREVIPKDGMSPAQACDLLRGISAGLSHAHKLGVVHRDLKPDNIMLNHHGQIKIMDLGLAKRDENKTAITKTGDTFGTPAYMAPEQIAGGGAPDPRTDQYAVGVISYELFTGRRPFEEEDSLQMIMKHLQEVPASIREFKPNLPEALAEAVARMLAKDPSARYANMQAACAAIEDALRGK